VACLTALLVASAWLGCFHLPGFWLITGIGGADNLFLDLRHLLAAGQAAQLGLDPHTSNPFDPYHRLYGFTDWWLLLGQMGLTLDDTLWLGTSLIGATLLATVSLLRPANWRQGATVFVVLVSPPLLFALNRANHDLVVFVIMCLALACLRDSRSGLRALGILLLAVSAALKYFPLAAGLILLDARSRRELVLWGLLYALVLLLAWPAMAEGLQVSGRNTPAPSWLFAFGAPVIFRELGVAASGALGWLAAGTMLLTGAGSWWRSATRRQPAATGTAADWEREYACGAVMLVGCFLHGSSYLYKMVFALWLLPWLWRAALSPAEERWRRATQRLLLAVLWVEGGLVLGINLNVVNGLFEPATARRLLQGTVLFGQGLTWALMLCLWRGLLLWGWSRLTRLAQPTSSPQ
jgi:hypothetical protein